MAAPRRGECSRDRAAGRRGSSPRHPRRRAGALPAATARADDRLDRLGADADALPPDERSRAHASLDALEADLDRVRRKAARAAFRIAGRGDRGRAAGPDGRIEAVHALLRGLGESVEPGDVRAAVTAALRNAMYRSASGGAAAGLDGAALARHVFAVVALAIVLARQGRPGEATS